MIIERGLGWVHDGDTLCTATPAQYVERIAELEAALRDVVDGYTALSGPRAHHIGCLCGGSPDGIHSCRTFASAMNAARQITVRG